MSVRSPLYDAARDVVSAYDAATPEDVLPTLAEAVERLRILLAEIDAHLAILDGLRRT